MIGFVARAASCWRVRSDRRGRLVPQLAYVGERRDDQALRQAERTEGCARTHAREGLAGDCCYYYDDDDDYCQDHSGTAG